MQEWTSALVQHSFSCKYITSQWRSRLCLLRTNMDENQLQATFNALHCLHLPLIMSSISKCFCENMKQTPRLSGWPIPATWAVNPRDLFLCCRSNFTCLFYFFYCMFDIVYDAEWLWQVILLHPPQKKRAWHFKYTFAWVHLYLTVWCLAFFKHTQTLWRRPPLPSLPPPHPSVFPVFPHICSDLI